MQAAHVDFVPSRGLEKTEAWAHARLYYLKDPNYTLEIGPRGREKKGEGSPYFPTDFEDLAWL